MTVLRIKFSTDLTEDYPGPLGVLLNEMRYNMELERWKADMRKARETNDFEWMDRLDRKYDYVGLP